MSRNVPPNALMTGAACVSVSLYSTGLLRARSTTLMKSFPLENITMKIGRTNRTMNTAKTIPTVKKRVCQNFDIRPRTLLFMTALSKLKVTSRRTRMVKIHSASKFLADKTQTPRAIVRMPDTRNMRRG